MSFTVDLKDKEFALSVGKMKISDTTLFFEKANTGNEKDIVMQINVTFTTDQLGPSTFTTDNQFGVFLTGKNMFADGIPKLFNTLVGNQLNITGDLNIATEGEKKEHEAVRIIGKL